MNTYCFSLIGSLLAAVAFANIELVAVTILNAPSCNTSNVIVVNQQVNQPITVLPPAPGIGASLGKAIKECADEIASDFKERADRKHAIEDAVSFRNQIIDQEQKAAERCFSEGLSSLAYLSEISADVVFMNPVILEILDEEAHLIAVSDN